jgi:hypothetical protein
MTANELSQIRLEAASEDFSTDLESMGSITLASATADQKENLFDGLVSSDFDAFVTQTLA